jgi:hypothetical protein
MLLLWFAAAVSKGWEMPDGSGRVPAGDVVIVSAEDRPDDTIKPRLLALDADIDRVKVVKAQMVIRQEGHPPYVDPQYLTDHAYWLEVFRRLTAPELFVVDPLPSFLGRNVNDSRNAEVQAVLHPFLENVLGPLDLCMIGNTHLNKNTDAKNPMHRIISSIAYGNVARNTHLVVRDPDDPERRFFKQAKCNNAPDDLPALAFKVEKRDVPGEGGATIETAIPVFEPEPVKDLNLAEVLAASGGARRGPKPDKSARLAEWLHDYLERGPAPVVEVVAAARDAGKLKAPDARNPKPSISPLYAARERISRLYPGWRVVEAETPSPKCRTMLKTWDLVEGEGREPGEDDDEADPVPF